MRISCRLLLQWTILLAIVVTAAIKIHAQIHGQSAPKRIEITARRFDFTPGQVTLKKGEPVILVLKSSDVAHGLRFRELHVELDAPTGSSAEVKFTPTKNGDFVGRCSVFCGSGHGSMALTLHVVD